MITVTEKTLQEIENEANLAKADLFTSHYIPLLINYIRLIEKDNAHYRRALC